MENLPFATSVFSTTLLSHDSMMPPDAPFVYMCCGRLKFSRICELEFRVVEERVSAQNWLGFDDFLWLFW